MSPLMHTLKFNGYRYISKLAYHHKNGGLVSKRSYDGTYNISNFSITPILLSNESHCINVYFGDGNYISGVTYFKLYDIDDSSTKLELTDRTYPLIGDFCSMDETGFTHEYWYRILDGNRFKYYFYPAIYFPGDFINIVDNINITAKYICASYSFDKYNVPPSSIYDYSDYDTDINSEDDFISYLESIDIHTSKDLIDWKVHNLQIDKSSKVRVSDTFGLKPVLISGSYLVDNKGYKVPCLFPNTSDDYELEDRDEHDNLVIDKAVLTSESPDPEDEKINVEVSIGLKINFNLAVNCYYTNDINDVCILNKGNSTKCQLTEQSDSEGVKYLYCTYHKTTDTTKVIIDSNDPNNSDNPDDSNNECTLLGGTSTDCIINRITDSEGLKHPYCIYHSVVDSNTIIEDVISEGESSGDSESN